MSVAIRRYAIVALIAFCIGTLSYTTITSVYKYRKARVTLQNVVTLFTTASVLRYGVVDAVDAERRLLTVTIRRVDADDTPTQILLTVPDTAFVAHEELTGEGGMYTSLSKRVPATLSDIRAGDRVAVFVQKTESALTAQIVLFGNPL